MGKKVKVTYDTCGGSGKCVIGKEHFLGGVEVECNDCSGEGEREVEMVDVDTAKPAN